MNRAATIIKRAWWHIFEESNEWEKLAKDKDCGPRKERHAMYKLKKEWDTIREQFENEQDFIEHMSFVPLVRNAPACLVKDLIFCAVMLDAQENQEEVKDES